ncbi:CLUMA_CG007860, isoform A [Clunio marinus]|uniref:CLUMA_CG007860, isoform A n=1 Tax=Clunio marinus TaxID=568069 RepID=A0A1J1I7F2_9DIPT|nr:CLUMA_CG007860, isoform A [Clunio marinus]
MEITCIKNLMCPLVDDMSDVARMRKIKGKSVEGVDDNKIILRWQQKWNDLFQMNINKQDKISEKKSLECCLDRFQNICLSRQKIIGNTLDTYIITPSRRLLHYSQVSQTSKVCQEI